MDDRLPTELWVMAHIRKCTAAGLPAYVVRKGAYASGAVIVKVAAAGQGCRLFTQSRDMDGNLGWIDVYDGMTDESRADDHIARAIARDPDLWVVEVEDPNGDNPFEGRILQP